MGFEALAGLALSAQNPDRGLLKNRPETRAQIEAIVPPAEPPVEIREKDGVLLSVEFNAFEALKDGFKGPVTAEELRIEPIDDDGYFTNAPLEKLPLGLRRAFNDVYRQAVRDKGPAPIKDDSLDEPYRWAVERIAKNKEFLKTLEKLEEALKEAELNPWAYRELSAFIADYREAVATWETSDFIETIETDEGPKSYYKRKIVDAMIKQGGSLATRGLIVEDYERAVAEKLFYMERRAARHYDEYYRNTNVYYESGEIALSTSR